MAYSSNGEALKLYPGGGYSYVTKEGEVINGKWTNKGDTLTLNSTVQPDSIPIKKIKEVAGSMEYQMCIKVRQNKMSKQAFAPMVLLHKSNGIKDTLFWDLSDCFKIPRADTSIRGISFLLPKGVGGGMASSRIVKPNMNSKTIKVLLNYPENGYPYLYQKNVELVVNAKEKAIVRLNPDL